MTVPSRSLKELFLSALEVAPADRAAWLDRECSGNAGLREQLNLMLAAHDAPQSLLDQPAMVEPDAALDQPITEKPGTVIGRYKLLEQIGEGGFGVVFMADQTEPVSRKVALKIIKPGMDTREVIARFQAERQALAIMDHPNIAKVLDAGATELGRPFFVMELVRGITITEFCDQNSLTTRERLELFASVCQAVQHAHQKGIIHRDIKPSNVMVTLRDDRPIPKVIDFGVAKATNQRLTEKTVFTRFAQMIGTPIYMSPEQAGMSELDIDTRSDIYSLGVLLYELLTGTTPFDQQRVREAAYDELLRIIREEEPPRPSLRVTTLGDTLPSVAANRKTEPKRLSTIFRGELDWIVMKALEKDRTRRYETTTSLSADIERYLSDEPVQACPPSTAYRFKKFARRNKIALSMVAVVAIVLLLGIVGTTWQAIRATREGQRAVEAEQLASSRLKAEAQAKREKIELLWQSYLNEAKALRFSGRQGQRFKSLEAIRKAAEILVSLGQLDEHALELRNEAIACMALVDVREVRQWDPPSPLAFDADYFRYAKSNSANEVSIHRVEDNRELFRLEGAGTPVIFSPDGRFLAGWKSGKRCLVWDLASRKLILDVPLGEVYSIDFSLDGSRITVGQKDNNIHIYKLPAGNEIVSISVGQPLGCVQFDPQAKRLAVSLDLRNDDLQTGVEIWDADTGQRLKTLTHPVGVSDMFHALAWSSDGRFLGVAGRNTAYVWNAKTYERLSVCDGHNSWVLGCRFSHAGDLLATHSWDGTVRFWSPHLGRQMLSLNGDFGHFSFSGNDRLLARIEGNAARGLWEVVPGRELRTLTPLREKKPECQGVAIHPDGRLMVTCNAAGLGVWDLHTGKMLAELPPEMMNSVCFTGAGDSLLAGGWSGLYRWPLKRLADRGYQLGPPELLDSMGPSRAPRVCVSSDDRFVAAVAGVGKAVVISLDDPTHKVFFSENYPDIDSVALSADGRLLATGTFVGESVKVWDTRERKHVVDLSPAGPNSRVAFSPDGKHLVAGTASQFNVWEVGTWRSLYHIPNRQWGGVAGLTAFSRDGSVLAISDTRYAVKLVNPASGLELATFTSPDPAMIRWMTLSDDASRVAVANWNKYEVWDVRSIREQLREMGLDWDPQLPMRRDEPEFDDSPLRIEIDLGDLKEVKSNHE